jgi:predicted DNA-binding transcriptional regulator YafY
MRESIGVRAFGAKLQAPGAELLPAIQSALLERRTLQVRYHSFSRDEETDRAIDPYHLTWHDSGLYLVARCHERTDVRIFAVERFRRVQPTRSRFTVPADFDLTAYLENALGIVRGTQVKVRVVFDKSVAPYIRERRWHSSQAIRDLPDGRVEVRLTVADTLEVRRWILGYGSQAEVLEPASLREALRTEAEALARTLTPRRRPLALLGRRPASEQTNGAAEGEQGAGQGRGGGPRLSR